MDENGINFYQKSNASFEEAKSLIEQKIGSANNIKTSVADELEKLASLKEKGIITQDEFNAKKKQLLGL
jgi:predicted Zn-dependent peptidase